MNHGYDDDDDYGGWTTLKALRTGAHATQADISYPAPAQAGPSGLLAQMLGGMNRYSREPPPMSAYDEYFKAYSVAMMGGNERPSLMYGGKIIMPPSALARLSSMDIPGPWCFQLRNPRSPTNITHAGVLEFIAEEGLCYLPAWMMKTLNLEEGGAIRLSGATLPKGKMVKIQAQSVDFIEVADAKAVLESALRSYSALSKGDIIEITYNSLTFEFLIMETVPEGPGISILDTDLEVDFATPVGYVEPPRKAPAPIRTMADTLGIDLTKTTSVSGASTRPASVNSNKGAATGAGEAGEIFTGIGQSMNGKKVNGKGLRRKIEEVDPSSTIIRHEGPRIITPDSLADQDRKVPAALVLPAGKFFFGFKYVPFDPSKVVKKKDKEESKAPASFGGEGNQLRPRRNQPQPPTPASSAPRSPAPAAEEVVDHWGKLGGGNSLSSRKKVEEKPKVEEKKAPTREEVLDMTMLDEDDFYEYVDDDDGDDVIEIDSD
ncbi:ubiquitin fusion degradation protein 1, partial [Tremellales sp. Uapishka_1]